MAATNTLATMDPRTLSVKNTFIEFNCDDLPGTDDPFGMDEPYRRQATEPVPCTSKLLEATPKARMSSIAEGFDTVDSLPSMFFPDTDCEDSDSIDGGCSPDSDSDSIGSAAEQDGAVETARKSGYGGSDEDASYTTLSGSASIPYQYSEASMTPLTTWPTAAMGFPLVAYPTAPTMEASWANVSTVMMRNLPNKVTQEQLLSEMNGAGFLNTYDFVYLPIDPDTHANKGYSFINFVSPGMAWIFKMHFEGEKLCSFHSKKTVAVVPATLQGFEANYAHYAGAHVQYRDAGSRPLFLREPKADATQQFGRQRDAESLIDVASKQLRKQHEHQQQLQQQILEQQKQHLMYAPCVVSTTAFASGGRPEGVSEALVAKFCCNCGGGIQASFKFCKFCGAPVQS